MHDTKLWRHILFVKSISAIFQNSITKHPDFIAKPENLYQRIVQSEILYKQMKFRFAEAIFLI